MPQTIETRVALLEQAGERDRDDIIEIKMAVGRVQTSINRALIACCGLLFTTVVNLFIALTRLGGK